jgi:hypothetical protein
MTAFAWGIAVLVLFSVTGAPRAWADDDAANRPKQRLVENLPEDWPNDDTENDDEQAEAAAKGNQLGAKRVGRVPRPSRPAPDPIKPTQAPRTPLNTVVGDPANPMRIGPGQSLPSDAVVPDGSDPGPTDTTYLDPGTGRGTEGGEPSVLPADGDAPSAGRPDLRALSRRFRYRRSEDADADNDTGTPDADPTATGHVLPPTDAATPDPTDARSALARLHRELDREVRAGEISPALAREVYRRLAPYAERLPAWENDPTTLDAAFAAVPIPLRRPAAPRPPASVTVVIPAPYAAQGVAVAPPSPAPVTVNVQNFLAPAAAYPTAFLMAAATPSPEYAAFFPTLSATPAATRARGMEAGPPYGAAIAVPQGEARWAAIRTATGGTGTATTRTLTDRTAPKPSTGIRGLIARAIASWRRGALRPIPPERELGSEPAFSGLRPPGEKNPAETLARAPALALAPRLAQLAHPQAQPDQASVIDYLIRSLPLVFFLLVGRALWLWWQSGQRRLGLAGWSRRKRG